jgi:hypothetical protein
MSKNDRIAPDAQGTLLPEGSYAVCYHPEHGYRVMLPDHENELPEEALALVACGARLPDDPDFRAEQVAWMERMHQEIKAQE